MGIWLRRVTIIVIDYDLYFSTPTAPLVSRIRIYPRAKVMLRGTCFELWGGARLYTKPMTGQKRVAGTMVYITPCYTIYEYTDISSSSWYTISFAFAAATYPLIPCSLYANANTTFLYTSRPSSASLCISLKRPCCIKGFIKLPLIIAPSRFCWIYNRK